MCRTLPVHSWASIIWVASLPEMNVVPNLSPCTTSMNVAIDAYNSFRRCRVLLVRVGLVLLWIQAFQ